METGTDIIVMFLLPEFLYWMDKIQAMEGSVWCFNIHLDVDGKFTVNTRKAMSLFWMLRSAMGLLLSHMSIKMVFLLSRDYEFKSILVNLIGNCDTDLKKNEMAEYFSVFYIFNIARIQDCAPVAIAVFGDISQVIGLSSET